MNAVQVFRAFGPVDAKMIRRDSMLAGMLALPVVMGLAMRFVLPFLAGVISRLIQFDLQPYYPVVLNYIVLMMMPCFAGCLVGLLLLDQRDDRTLTALQVTPLSLKGYLQYRLAVPTFLGFVMTMVAVPLAGLMEMSFGTLLLSSLISAPLAPITALVFAAIAGNKVQGLAVMKVLGAVTDLPIVAFFLPEKWQLVFGLFPTYWPAKVFTMLQHNQPGAWIYALVAMVYQLALIWLLARRFYHQMTH